jgi:hypothetical protein
MVLPAMIQIRNVFSRENRTLYLLSRTSGIKGGGAPTLVVEWTTVAGSLIVSFPAFERP